MKYSLMSLMIDPLLKVNKPSFIHMHILDTLGYKGKEPTVDEMFTFFNEHGVPMKNGTMTFEDMVRFAKESGFDGLDLMRFNLTVSGVEAKEILDRYSIVLSSANVIIPFASVMCEEEYRGMMVQAKADIDECCEAGAKQIMFVPAVYNLPEGLTMEKSVQNCIRALNELVAYCDEKKVIISTETLESAEVAYCTCGEMLRIFENVQGLKYTHDTGNPIIGLEDPLATYEMFKENVSYIHFKEYAYVDDADAIACRNGKRVKRVPYGQGVIDFRSHLKALKENQYDGFINLEGHSREDDLLEGTRGALAYFKAMEAELD